LDHHSTGRNRYRVARSSSAGHIHRLAMLVAEELECDWGEFAPNTPA
jgi:hypothetical protein